MVDAIGNGLRRVDVGPSPTYPVVIGAGATRAIAELPLGRKVALVEDGAVTDTHGLAIANLLTSTGRTVHRLPVTRGERDKSIDTWAKLHGALARAGLGRDDAVVAVGGGVVCDLAGFVAATYLRGVDVVHVPTTVLAMADASIGGKTGVNLREGKNLVGAFWRPKAVLMDVATLRTLPARTFASGSVEMFKHGLLARADLVDAIVTRSFGPHASDEDTAVAIEASARVKARVVEGDEREAGLRATLNLGHTVAHALEAVTDHALDHGVAVAHGLLYAAHLSALHYARVGGPTVPWTDVAKKMVTIVASPPLPDLVWDDLVPFIARDKKTKDGERRWVLMPRPQDARVERLVEPDDERAAWHAYLEDVREIQRRQSE